MHDLIDIGANLTHDSFDKDRQDVMDRAAAVGVARMIVTGASKAGSEQAYELSTAYPDILFATAGVHPHHASEYDAATADTILELCQHSSVVAVGECGLDYFRNFSPREDQLAAFKAQLEETGGFQILAGDPVAYSDGSTGWLAGQPTLALQNGTEIKLRLTAVFQKEQGEWKIVQWHYSTGVKNENLIGEMLTI